MVFHHMILSHDFQKSRDKFITRFCHMILSHNSTGALQQSVERTAVKTVLIRKDQMDQLKPCDKSVELCDKNITASLQNCWQVPGHCQLLTDITSTSTCQISLTSPHNARGTGSSMQLQPGRGLIDNKLTLKAFKLSL